MKTTANEMNEVKTSLLRGYMKISSEIIMQALRDEANCILTEEYEKAYHEAENRAKIRIAELVNSIKFAEHEDQIRRVKTISPEF